MELRRRLLGFNPLERGIGIGGTASRPQPARPPSFNPLERGIGIGGLCSLQQQQPERNCFNPLERGIGIGGINVGLLEFLRY